jgi:hypothetical protein
MSDSIPLCSQPFPLSGRPEQADGRITKTTFDVWKEIGYPKFLSCEAGPMVTVII